MQINGITELIYQEFDEALQKESSIVSYLNEIEFRQTMSIERYFMWNICAFGHTADMNIVSVQPEDHQ